MEYYSVKISPTIFDKCSSKLGGMMEGNNSDGRRQTPYDFTQVWNKVYVCMCMCVCIQIIK